MKDRRAKPANKPSLADRLRNPAFMKTVTTVAIIAAAYLGIYSPLSSNIDDCAREIKAEHKRLEIVREVERLRGEYDVFKKRLPEKSDTNEWVQYILGGIRQFPVKLQVLNPDVVRDVGPYKAVVLRIEIEGSLMDMNGFLKWLETNQRLIRVDAVSVEPSMLKNGSLVMHLTVLGLFG